MNDCPDDLQPYLCPTDCRLRPDQRAFETGQYELANTLKIRQEEYQRSTRKKREEGLVPPHRPRWFNATTDSDSRERVWAPVRVDESGPLDYWTTREKLWQESSGKGKLPWPGVDDIFIEVDG